MESLERVIRNSFWTGIQPLLLNLISLFAIGYIADALGQDDYGKFVFAFAFVAIFMSSAQGGLRAITVREIASGQEESELFIGSMLTLRMLLAGLSYIILVFIVNILGYPSSTRSIVYLAGATILLNAVALTLFDIFQAYEKMKYVAYSNFVSGAILTVLSVAVIYTGHGLIALTMSYVFGSLVLSFVAMFFYVRRFSWPKIVLNGNVMLRSLRKAFPFFLIGLVAVLNGKIGFVILSKLSGDAATGLYGAASNLTDRLNIIPDSIATAVFPAMASLYESSRREVGYLFEKFFRYLILVGMPIGVGTTVLSEEILRLIYRDKYLVAWPTLSILAWTVPFLFVRCLQGYTFGAINMQNRELVFLTGATVINISLCFVFVPFFAEAGIAAAQLVSAVVVCVYASYVLHKTLRFRFYGSFILKLMGANLIMCIPAILLRNISLLLAVAVAGVIYVISVKLLGLLSANDLILLRRLLKKPIS